MSVTKYFILLVIFAGSLVSFKNQDITKKARNSNDKKRNIASVRYAPDGMYMKDHYLIYHKGKWHLFAPLGKIGTMWHYEGSEESSELMISSDLLNWEYVGTAVPASRKEGHFDRLMGGIAPCVLKHEGRFYMIYSGWDFKSKSPRNFEGFRQGVGIALSSDLVNWEKPEKYAREGIGAHGSDPFVVRDEENNRWLLFTTRSGAVAVYTGTDLFSWTEAGLTLDEKDLKVGMTGMNPAESPFIMKHPKSGKWMILMNGGYAVSDNPLDFPAITPYPFKSGIYTFPEPRNEGKGTYYYAEDDGTGFAHEIIEFKGQWYMTGAVGVDGHTKLKLTPVEWTEEGFRLAQ